MTIHASQFADLPELAHARKQVELDQLNAAQLSYQDVIENRPTHIRALLEAARLHGIRFQPAEAEGLLRRATELADGDRRVMIAIAQCFRTIHRPRAGIAALTALDKEAELPPPLLAELAELYELHGQLNEAREAIERSARLAGDRPEPQLILARIERQLGETDKARERAQVVAKRAEAQPLLRAQAWAELCYLHDADGDYAAAVAAIDQAKLILRGLPQTTHLIHQAAYNNRLLAGFYDRFDAIALERWSNVDLPEEPRVSGVAHLIGFPRSGTTLLEQVLGTHPGVADSPERAIFTRETLPAMYSKQEGNRLSFEALDSIPIESHRRHRGRYFDMMESLLDEPLAGRLHLDKNPNHTSLLVALLRLLPESKFLVALRDPRDVVVSCYLRYFNLTEFSSGFLTWQSACELYASEMRIWLRCRELLADRAIEIRYEDTVADLPAVARRTIEFLGLPRNDAILDYRDHANGKMINSPSHLQVRKPLNQQSIGRWRNYEDQLAPHMSKLAPFLEAFGYE